VPVQIWHGACDWHGNWPRFLATILTPTFLSNPRDITPSKLAVGASPFAFAFALPTITAKSSKWLPLGVFAPSNRINNEIDQIVVQTAECLASSSSTMRRITRPARRPVALVLLPPLSLLLSQLLSCPSMSCLCAHCCFSRFL